jgi:C4-dicarboxylate-specific signal transduction histidine kinase
VLTFSDISQRRQMELDTQRLRLELAHVSRVAGMGELVASLAHELNQPLTAIQSNAQAARRLMTSGKPDLAEIRDILADIVADDRRAAEVISRVRAQLQKAPSNRTTLDMNEVISEVLVFLRTEAIVKGVAVAAHLDSGRLSVVGDRIQLQQVLINLIVNAFDAMQTQPHGKRILTVCSSRSEKDEVLVAVEDSGDGIPPARMNCLFEPFVTSKPGGLGMGLAISRSIIESHGGRIWAENTPPSGALFQFALPVTGKRKE